MRKLINFDGGRGYYVNDVEQLQNQLESLKLVFAAFGNRAFIVHGCEVTPGATPGNYNVAPGLVHVGGRLTEVLGATNVPFSAIGLAYIYTVSNNGFNGAAFENYYYDLLDQSRAAFQLFHGQVSAVPPAPGIAAVVLSARPNGRVTWIDYLKLLLTNEETWVFFDDWQNTGAAEVRYRKDFQGIVRFKGKFLRTDNGAQLTQFTLPVGFRPIFGDTFYVNGGKNGSNGNRDAARYGVEVLVDGTVRAVIVDAGSPPITGNFWCPMDDVWFEVTA